MFSSSRLLLVIQNKYIFNDSGKANNVKWFLFYFQERKSGTLSKKHYLSKLSKNPPIFVSVISLVTLSNHVFSLQAIHFMVCFAMCNQFKKATKVDAVRWTKTASQLNKRGWFSCLHYTTVLEVLVSRFSLFYKLSFEWQVWRNFISLTFKAPLHEMFWDLRAIIKQLIPWLKLLERHRIAGNWGRICSWKGGIALVVLEILFNKFTCLWLKLDSKLRQSFHRKNM